MPVWRCPHCATPQAEASRCWVCRRSTTSCVTCRHYRRAITGGLGLCGLDPRHPAVTDTDVRACWVGAPTSAAGVAVGPGPLDWLVPEGVSRALGRRATRTFVPVEDLAEIAEGVTVAVLERSPGVGPSPVEAAGMAREADPSPVGTSDPAQVAPATPGDNRTIPGRWWLWGDPEPWPER